MIPCINRFPIYWIQSISCGVSGVYRLPALEILVSIEWISFNSEKVLLKELGSFLLMKLYAKRQFCKDIWSLIFRIFNFLKIGSVCALNSAK